MSVIPTTSVFAHQTTFNAIPYTPTTCPPKSKAKLRPAASTGLAAEPKISNADQIRHDTDCDNIDHVLLLDPDPSSFDPKEPTVLKTIELPVPDNYDIAGLGDNIVEAHRITKRSRPTDPESKSQFSCETKAIGSVINEDTSRTPQSDGTRHDHPILRERSTRSYEETEMEVVGMAPKSGPNDLPLPKRQKLSKNGPGSRTLEPIPTPESMCMSTCSSPKPHLRTKDKISEDTRDNQSHRGSEEPILSSQSFTKNLAGDDDSSASANEMAEGQSDTSKLSTAIPYDEAGNRRKDQCGDSDTSHALEDELDQIDSMCPGRPEVVYTGEHGNSVLSHNNQSPRKPLKQRDVSPRASRSPSQEQAKPSDKALSCSLRHHPSRTEHRADMEIIYQVTDATDYNVPKGSSISMATVWCPDPNAASRFRIMCRELLGGPGKILRVIEMSSGLWMVLGYRIDVRGTPSSEHQTIHNSKRTSPVSDEEYKDRAQNQPRHKPQAEKRVHVAWRDSDGARLMAYKDTMDMEWDKITALFPGRTEGAVKTHYYELRKTKHASRKPASRKRK